jgi:Na+-transporting NADH:ubiquinone oxidoreductase subunit C
MFQLNSTRYIVTFAVIVCVICSVMVSSAAVLLKSRQRANAVLDKQRNVLQVAGLIQPGETVDAARVQALFDERVEIKLIDTEAGRPASDLLGIDPHTYDQRRATGDPAMSHEAEPNLAAVSRVPNYLTVYEIYPSADRARPDLYVLPIEGLGLWGTLYGFLALEHDAKTVRGITYYSHKETPGLGGEVDNPLWRAKWPGREAFDEEGRPAIRVIKGPAGPASEDPHHVDGLSGATITSNGVTHMLQFWLGEQGFGPYLASLRREGSAA